MGKFTRISDYGLIGNSRTAALVSNRGSVDWCCFPRFDSPSFFDSILGPPGEGGFFSICPEGQFESEQRYIPDTNVLDTTFFGANGVARLMDCFTVCSEKAKQGMLWPDHEILRVLEGVSGQIPIRIRFSPQASYGKRKLQLSRIGDWAICCHHKTDLLVLQTDLGGSSIELVEREGGTRSEASAQFVLRAGERVIVSLSYANEAPAVLPPLGQAAMDRLKETIAYWRAWIDRSQYIGPYVEQVRRSALTLKLLTFAPSGAVVAAPTMSLPEEIGGIRNWDYRYCWLRDASFTVRAFMRLGYFDEAKSYMSWLLYTTALTRPRLQTVYSVYGESRLPEKVLSWLDGYRDSRPVRLGNDAWKQLQFDTYGEVLNALYSLVPHLDVIDHETRKFVVNAGDAVCALWNQPDHGIWEMRSGRAQHTHSKVFCWVAIDRIIRVARSFGWKFPAHYEQIAVDIRNAIETHGFNPRVRAYTRSFGSDELDASLLALPLVGYCDVESERMQDTIQAVLANLTENGLIYRYRPQTDGLRGDEGAFGICNFWMASLMAKMGRIEDAQYWFESIANRATSTGLLPEEVNPMTGEFLGNFPQAFTHIGLINSAINLTQARRSRREAAA